MICITFVHPRFHYRHLRLFHVSAASAVTLESEACRFRSVRALGRFFISLGEFYIPIFFDGEVRVPLVSPMTLNGRYKTVVSSISTELQDSPLPNQRTADDGVGPHAPFGHSET